MTESIRPSLSFVEYDPAQVINVRDGCTTVTDWEGGEQVSRDDPLAVLHRLLRGMKAICRGLPVGPSGILATTWCGMPSGCPNARRMTRGIPTCNSWWSDRLIAYDTVRQTMMMIVSIPTDDDVEAHYQQAWEEIFRIFERIRMEGLLDNVPSHRQISPPEWHIRPDATEFMSIVCKAK